MPEEEPRSWRAPLHLYRVLDLTDELGWLCGHILAELGATVVKVEPPGGDPGRRVPPLVEGASGETVSAVWLAYNSGKRGITLDLEADAGRRALLDLVAHSHFLIESFKPGYLKSIGLGWELLRQRHRLQPYQDDDFWLRNLSEVLQTQEESSKVMTYLLAAIASVSLLVGGIGIMNIMLVSVTERTREIGVRKALGATRVNILLQFVVEAVVLCLIGGVIGILLGSAGAMLLSRLAHWNTLISPAAVLLAFGCSVAVGLFFGIWPARRAARVDAGLGDLHDAAVAARKKDGDEDEDEDEDA